MMRSALGLAFTLVLAGGIAGCSSNNSGHDSGGSSMDMKTSEATASAYTCSMHPEVKSDKPGTCPKCGMAQTPKSESF
jgi:hypothetical protein